MTNKVSIQDVVNGTPAGKEAVQRAVEASIKDQDAMSAKAQAMRSDTNELEREINSMICDWNAPSQLAVDMEATCKRIAHYVISKEAEAYKKGYIDSGVQAINKGYADGLTEFKGDI